MIKEKKYSVKNSEEQNNFKADFGFDAPHRTAKECSAPGWVAKTICTGCGKEYKKNQRGFYLDKRLS